MKMPTARGLLVAATVAIAVAGFLLYVGASLPHVDGSAHVMVKTSRGDVRITVGLGAARRYGRTIESEVLLKEVAARNLAMAGVKSAGADEQLSSGDLQVLGAAAILARAGEPKTLLHLLTLLDDPYYQVRNGAAEALATFGDRRAAPFILEKLERCLFSDGPLVRAIGVLGDDKAIPVLINRIPGGGSMNTSNIYEAIEKITGLSLAPIRDQYGMTFYNGLSEHRERMHRWWRENQHASRNGQAAVVAPAPADAPVN
jgi:hypothetical protein